MYFVAIFKCPLDDDDYEIVNVVKKNLSEKEAEKLVVETNKNLGHRIEADGSVFAGPGELVAMCDYVDELE